MTGDTLSVVGATGGTLQGNSLEDFPFILLSYGAASTRLEANWITSLKSRRLSVTGIAGFVDVDYIRQEVVVYDPDLVTVEHGAPGFRTVCRPRSLAYSTSSPANPSGGDFSASPTASVTKPRLRSDRTRRPLRLDAARKRRRSSGATPSMPRCSVSDAAGCSYDDVFLAATAVVEPGVNLGAGVRIWHHDQVRIAATIGVEVIVGKDCFIDSGVVSGPRYKIQKGGWLYAPAQLGSGVVVGPGVILTNDWYPRAISTGGRQLSAEGWTTIGGAIGDGASIGAGTVVVCTEVAEWALVRAGSVVTPPVIAHSLVAGSPARQIGWVCFCSVREDSECSECGWRIP